MTPRPYVSARTSAWRPAGLSSLALTVALGAAMPAPGTAQPTTGGRWIAFDNYDERRSRAAFKACDQDGDDRLNVVEARLCLAGIGTAEDLSGFQAFDLNRDGFLHWSEFDQRFKLTTKRGSTFRFLPARPFSDPSAGTRAKGKQIPKEQHAAELVVAMANVDDDPHINRAEFIGLLKALGQPASLASSFDAVDLDKSGSLSKAEFVPVLSAVPFLAQLVLAQSSKTEDRTGPANLSRRLAGLHPSLQRWHQVVFRDADRNRNGMLEKNELKTSAAPPQPARKPVQKGRGPGPGKKPASGKPGK